MEKLTENKIIESLNSLDIGKFYFYTKQNSSISFIIGPFLKGEKLDEDVGKSIEQLMVKL